MGGMQRVSLQLTEQLDLSPEIELHEVTMETRWRFIGFKTFLFLARLLFFLPGMTRRYKPDLILFSSLVTGSLSYFVRKRVSVPMVSISHGHDVTLRVPMYQWLLRRMLQRLDAVISVSSATRQECLNRGLAQEKSKVLPNGFDAADLKRVVESGPARAFIAEHFGLDLDGKKLLLTVGRLIKRKGHGWFIEKVLPLVESEVVYLVIGDGAERDAVARLAGSSEAAEDIILAGRQPDTVLEMAYAAADLFIMPNVPVPGDMEGFGVVVLEANIRNTPAIASDMEGIKDVIGQGENGYRIAALDARAFAKKIDEVLRTELQPLSQRCRTYVESRFCWEQVAQDYIAYLKTVAERGQR